MEFERSRTAEIWGKKIGYIIGYLVFTTILHLILTWLNKLPAYWNYGYSLIGTAIITLIGLGIKRLLK